jgi:hypothetical protein
VIVGFVECGGFPAVKSSREAEGSPSGTGHLDGRERRIPRGCAGRCRVVERRNVALRKSRPRATRGRRRARRRRGVRRPENQDPPPTPAPAIATRPARGESSPGVRGLLRRLGQHGRPVAVGLLDDRGELRGPLLLQVLVVVEVQLAVDDLPGFGIRAVRVVPRDRPGAVAAELRRVLLRRRLERVPVRGRREAPFRASPLGLELRPALRGLAAREVGDGVVARDGEAVLFCRRGPPRRRRQVRLPGKSGQRR